MFKKEFKLYLQNLEGKLYLTKIHQKFGKNCFHTLQSNIFHRPLTLSSSLKIAAAYCTVHPPPLSPQCENNLPECISGVRQASRLPASSGHNPPQQSRSIMSQISVSEPIPLSRIGRKGMTLTPGPAMPSWSLFRPGGGVKIQIVFRKVGHGANQWQYDTARGEGTLGFAKKF
jgi:hypothetical protein